MSRFQKWAIAMILLVGVDTFTIMEALRTDYLSLSNIVSASTAAMISLAICIIFINEAER